MKSRLSVLGLVISCIFVFLGIFGPQLAPYNYMSQDLGHTCETPSWQHLLGTDLMGRDQLSRILWGAQTALQSVVIVTTLSLAIGMIIGSVSAYAGGLVDTFFTWVITVVMTIPGLLLATLVDFAVREPASELTHTLYELTQWQVFSVSSYTNYLIVFASLAFVRWPHYAQLIRGQVLSISQQDYVLAARSVGVRPGRVISRYLIPNALGPVVITAALGALDIVVLESSLSYLGVGIRPPAASWGDMISRNLQMWSYRPHLVFVPVAVLGLMAIGLGFLGSGLADALDPRRSKSV